jgi:hypothetical protein
VEQSTLKITVVSLVVHLLLQRGNQAAFKLWMLSLNPSCHAAKVSLSPPIPQQHKNDPNDSDANANGQGEGHLLVGQAGIREKPNAC